MNYFSNQKKNIFLLLFCAIILVFALTLINSNSTGSIQTFKKHFLNKKQNIHDQDQINNSEFFLKKNTTNTQNQEEVIKPQIDKNNYEIFTTSNGIKTLLISTDEPQDFGASLTIKGVGSYQDGNSTQGISHFVEHLLFTGSKNYPNWELVQDISLKGGIFNGLTMSNTTQYPVGFSDLQVLEETLEKIVDFIINPRLAEDVINKEIYAISAEYHLDIVDSTQKIEYIWKLLSSPNSRFHNFDVGNTDSLKSVLKDPKILKDFIERTYVPENMFLVIYTSEQLKQQTKKKVSSIFEAIPKRKSPEVYKIPPVFEQNGKQCFVKLKDSSKIQELTLSFNVQTYDSYKTKSLDYVLQLLQSGGDSNFCNYVTNKKWATDCQIGSESLTRYEAMIFSVITLTKSGAGQIQEIIYYYFQFLQLIKSIGVQEKYYDIFKQMNKVYFEFQEQEDIFDLLTDIGLKFSWNPNKNVLFQDFNYEKFDRQEILQILNQIQVSNAIFILRSSNFQGYYNQNKNLNDFLFSDQQFYTNKLWDFQYNIYNFTEYDIDYIENQLPVKNGNFKDIESQKMLYKMPKIIKNKKSDKKNDNEPQLLKSNEQGNLWFYQEQHFKIPFTAQLILLDHNKGITGVKEQFYLQFLATGLNIYFYDQFFQATPRGLEIVIFMPSNFEQMMGNYIIKKYRDFKFNTNDVDYIKETMSNNYISQKETYSLQENLSFLRQIWGKNQYTLSDFIIQLEIFNFQDFQNWFKNYQENTHAEVLIMGNIVQKDAEQQYQQLIKTLDFKSIDQFISDKNQSIHKFQGSNILQRYSEEYDHFNQSIINLYQLPDDIDTQKMSLVINYLNLYFSAYSFDFLRSQNQLGYIAEAGIMEKNGIYHLFVLVVGFRFSPSDMDQKIEEMFDFIYKILEKQYKEEQFIMLENFVYKTPGSPQYYAFNQQVGSFWEEIVEETYFGFQQNSKNKVEPQKKIQQKNLLNYYKQWFQQNGNKISVQLINPFRSDQLLEEIQTKNYNGIQQNNVYNTVNQLLQDNKFKLEKSNKYPIVNIQN